VGILVDALGLYVVGHARDALPGQTSYGFQDVFVRRYDLDGNELWTRQFGTWENEGVRGVGADESGVYLVGYTYAALPGQVHTIWEDSFVRKYDPNGNEMWTDEFGMLGYEYASDYATHVATDVSGVYVVGYGYGALPGQTWAGSADAYVRRYDIAGNLLWTRQFGSPGGDFTSAVFADASGILVAGTAGNALPGQSWAGSSDIFVRRYDPDGNEVWTRQFGSTASDSVSSFAVDASGMYVAGSTSGALPGQTRVGGTDAFIRRMTLAGDAVWTRQFGTPASDSVARIEVDFTGVYVAGSTSGALPGQTWAGLADAYVRKYDQAGNEVWTRQIGTAAAETGNMIATDFTDVYLVGATRGAFPGYASDGTVDAFVLKISFTPRQKMSLCAGLVQDLVSAGVLNRGQGNSLLVKLAAADAQLARGNAVPAMNILHAFINEVNAMVQSGRLSPAQGQLLAGFVANIIDQIRSGG